MAVVDDMVQTERYLSAHIPFNASEQLKNNISYVTDDVQKFGPRLTLKRPVPLVRVPSHAALQQ